jgi:hypothetical protein
MRRGVPRGNASDKERSHPEHANAIRSTATQPGASHGQAKSTRDDFPRAITVARASDRITVRDALPARRRRSITFLASEHRRISRTLRDTCLTPAPYCV